MQYSERYERIMVLLLLTFYYCVYSDHTHFKNPYYVDARVYVNVNFTLINVWSHMHDLKKSGWGGGGGGEILSV